MEREDKRRSDSTSVIGGDEVQLAPQVYITEPPAMMENEVFGE